MSVSAAAVSLLSAAVPFPVMAVMATVYMGIIIQFSGQECIHGPIRYAGYAAVKSDAAGSQRILRAADTAADQHIDLLSR